MVKQPRPRVWFPERGNTRASYASDGSQRVLAQDKKTCFQLAPLLTTLFYKNWPLMKLFEDKDTFWIGFYGHPFAVAYPALSAQAAFFRLTDPSPPVCFLSLPLHQTS